MKEEQTQTLTYHDWAVLNALTSRKDIVITKNKDNFFIKSKDKNTLLVKFVISDDSHAYKIIMGNDNIVAAGYLGDKLADRLYETLNNIWWYNHAAQRLAGLAPKDNKILQYLATQINLNAK